MLAFQHLSKWMYIRGVSRCQYKITVTSGSSKKADMLFFHPNRPYHLIRLRGKKTSQEPIDFNFAFWTAIQVCDDIYALPKDKDVHQTYQPLRRVRRKYESEAFDKAGLTLVKASCRNGWWIMDEQFGLGNFTFGISVTNLKDRLIFIIGGGAAAITISARKTVYSFEITS